MPNHIVEKEQINALYLDFKQHYEAMKQQLQLASHRLAEEVHARRELEVSQEQRLSDMKRAIEVKQREIEQMQQRMTLPVDSDVMRMKIAKDMEMRHRMDMDAKQEEQERVQEQYYEAKRQLEVVKAQVESLKYEHEKELSDNKSKHSHEVSSLLLENQVLLSKADDTRTRELLRQLRHDLDAAKHRTTELLGEVADLRRERDLLKLDKNDMVVQHVKEMEEERNKRRCLESEKERVEIKHKAVEEERNKALSKLEKKQNEL